MPKVYLTGTGPWGCRTANWEKAVRVIENADVLIYDRLVNPEILI